MKIVEMCRLNYKRNKKRQTKSEEKNKKDLIYLLFRMKKRKQKIILKSYYLVLSLYNQLSNQRQLTKPKKKIKLFFIFKSHRKKIRSKVINISSNSTFQRITQKFLFNMFQKIFHNQVFRFKIKFYLKKNLQQSSPVTRIHSIRTNKLCS